MCYNGVYRRKGLVTRSPHMFCKGLCFRVQALSLFSKKGRNMKTAMEVLDAQLPGNKGRAFNSEATFLGWIATLASHKSHGLTADEFYSEFENLVKAGSLKVWKRRGNVRVKVVR